MKFNLGSVNNALSGSASRIENDLQANLNSLQDGDVSQAEMIQIQYELSKWTMVTNLQSNVMKTVSEGIKSTIQNVR